MGILLYYAKDIPQLPPVNANRAEIILLTNSGLIALYFAISSADGNGPDIVVLCWAVT